VFEGLGPCANYFFEAKSFGLHISNPKSVPGNIVFYVSKMAMYHGYVSWLCIVAMYHGYVSWLYILAMYFEPESGPAGAFWAKYLISCESKVACKLSKRKSQSALNHVLIP
jgi:hypothetical protein